MLKNFLITQFNEGVMLHHTGWMTCVFCGHLYQKNTWVSQKYRTYMYVKLVQMAVVQEFHWMKQQSLLKVVPTSTEKSIWHQVMGPCKELLWLVLQSMHHYHLDICIQPKSVALHCFLEGIKYMQVTWWEVQVVWILGLCLPAYRVRHVTKHYITQYMYIYFLITTFTYYTPPTSNQKKKKIITSDRLKLHSALWTVLCMTSVTVSIQFYLISLQSIHILTAHICAQKQGHLCIWRWFWHIYTYTKKEALFGHPWDFTVCYQKRANIFCSCLEFCSMICTSYFETSQSANIYQKWVH